MNIKRDIIIILVLGVALAIFLYTTREDSKKTSADKSSTTNIIVEKKLPDSNSPEQKEISLTAKINNPAAGIGITIEPLEIIEDSRCPEEITCVQAGTVLVSVKITNSGGARTLIMTLGKSESSAHEKITLSSVAPVARAEIPIRTNEYRFTFDVVKL